MKNSGNTIHPFIKEVCSAVCAIVHANIHDNILFSQSGTSKKTMLSSLRKQCFSDNGVIVELDEGTINIILHVSAKVGHSSIFKNALELQYKIIEEIFLFTTFKTDKVNVIITDIQLM
ncbi:MAG TPA: hypothetical protein DCR24_07110 [Bacillus bacterium]|nr:hypothetical protein [Bacillus sp. (in: firmicutes)]